MAVVADTAAPALPPARSRRSRAATRSAAVSASPTRCSARASRRCSCCRRGRSSIRASGSCRSLTSRGTSAWSPSTRAATGSRTVRGAPTEYGPRVSAADALNVLDAVGADDCVLVAHCGIAAGALLLAAEHPERVRGAVFMSPALPLTPPRPERTGLPVRRGAADRRGLGQGQPPLLGARLPRLSRVLLRALLHGAALDQAARGRGRVGLRDDAGDARATRSRREDLPERRYTSCSAGSPARCSSPTATRTC